jgi:hypothetical protein
MHHRWSLLQRQLLGTQRFVPQRPNSKADPQVDAHSEAMPDSDAQVDADPGSHCQPDPEADRSCAGSEHRDPALDDA